MKEIEPIFLPYNVHTITKLDKSELPPPVTHVPKEETEKNDEDKIDKGKPKARNNDDEKEKNVVRERRGASNARAAARENRRASMR